MTWKPNYITNNTGKVFKISDLADKGVNHYIGCIHQTMKTNKIHLDLLYEQRALIIGEPVEEGKAIRKIKENLKIVSKETDEEGKRMKSIVLLALKYLEEGKDNALIIALLEQARNEV
tara:strand:- start:1261 stop:1614 length:354 start_codon:yes stop_codon:yes gene_type:complete